jgi:hypothetical protein
MSQAIPLPQKPHEEFSYWKMVWTRFRKHHLATFGGGFLLFMLVLCFRTCPTAMRFPRGSIGSAQTIWAEMSSCGSSWADRFPSKWACSPLLARSSWGR